MGFNPLKSLPEQSQLPQQNVQMSRDCVQETNCGWEVPDEGQIWVIDILFVAYGLRMLGVVPQSVPNSSFDLSQVAWVHSL
eukprot:5271168-Amphidinium_carterae.1